MTFPSLPCIDEPGKQVKSAIRIKNTSKSHVAFKVCMSYLIAQVYSNIVCVELAVYTLVLLVMVLFSVC